MVKQINNFLDDKTNQHLLAIATECKTFDEFVDNVGWEDWMSDFLERLGITTEEDELLCDYHCNLINNQLLKVWIKKGE